MNTPNHANPKPEDRFWYVVDRRQYRVAAIDGDVAWLRPINGSELGHFVNFPLSPYVFTFGELQKVGDKFIVHGLGHVQIKSIDGLQCCFMDEFSEKLHSAAYPLDFQYFTPIIEEQVK